MAATISSAGFSEINSLAHCLYSPISLFSATVRISLVIRFFSSIDNLAHFRYVFFADDSLGDPLNEAEPLEFIGVIKVMAVPCLPALPVLPIR
jgi:hypothetical protein